MLIEQKDLNLQVLAMGETLDDLTEVLQVDDVKKAIGSLKKKYFNEPNVLTAFNQTLVERYIEDYEYEITEGEGESAVYESTKFQEVLKYWEIVEEIWDDVYDLLIEEMGGALVDMDVNTADVIKTALEDIEGTFVVIDTTDYVRSKFQEFIVLNIADANGYYERVEPETQEDATASEWNK